MEISVIMSVFNGEDFLKSSILSILNQTYTDFEFIIIDDGSSDNSFKIIQNYANKDKRIKILRNPINIGLTKSLNKAILISKGKLIARQDVDDISLPNRLQKQINFLERNLNHAFCGTNGYIYNTRKNLTVLFNSKDIRTNLLLRNCFHHTSIVIRKNILDKYGYYDENYLFSQDYELWCRLIYKHNLRANNLHEKLIIRKKFSVSKKKFILQRFNSIKIMLKYQIYFKNNIKVCFSIIINICEIIIHHSIFLFFLKHLIKKTSDN